MNQPTHKDALRGQAGSNAVACRTCWHMSRGNYCALRMENVLDSSDACGQWESQKRGDPFAALRAACDGEDDLERNIHTTRRQR